MANDRLTQLPVEAVVIPTSQMGRMTQLPAEVIIQSTDAKARQTQFPVEVIIYTPATRFYATIITDAPSGL